MPDDLAVDVGLRRKLKLKLKLKSLELVPPCSLTTTTQWLQVFSLIFPHEMLIPLTSFGLKKNL